MDNAWYDTDTHQLNNNGDETQEMCSSLDPCDVCGCDVKYKLTVICSVLCVYAHNDVLASAKNGNICQPFN